MIINSKKEELGAGRSVKVCSSIVLKCLYLAAVDRPDIWMVGELLEWNKASRKRLAR